MISWDKLSLNSVVRNIRAFTTADRFNKLTVIIFMMEDVTNNELKAHFPQNLRSSMMPSFFRHEI